MRNLSYLFRNCFVLGSVFGSLILSCASNSVTTEIDKNKNPVTKPPTEFQSPLEAIKSLESVGRASDQDSLLLLAKTPILKTLLTQQTAVSKELKETGKLNLKPGFSYEFDLESFCVHAGVERPVQGDGLFLGDIQGGAKRWLPLILRDYKNKGITQQDAQVLIWSLLSGSRFDELNYKNQTNLLKLFPDAPLRFGHSIVQNYAESYLRSQVPSELLNAKEQINKYNNLLQDARKNFSEIEKVMSPHSSRVAPLEVGWLKHEDGYYIHLQAQGYQKVRVKIYSPESMKAGTYFDPTKHVVLPGQGQRLALSSSVVDEYQEKFNKLVKEKTGISTKEALFIVKHPQDAVKIYQAAQRAMVLTRKTMTSAHNFEDDRSDALRHFVWSGMTAHEIGSDKAKEFLTAHEDYPGNKPEAKSMDLFNNDQGIIFHNQYQGNNFERDLVQAGLDKITNGELRWIK